MLGWKWGTFGPSGALLAAAELELHARLLSSALLCVQGMFRIKQYEAAPTQLEEHTVHLSLRPFKPGSPPRLPPCSWPCCAPRHPWSRCCPSCCLLRAAPRRNRPCRQAAGLPTRLRLVRGLSGIIVRAVHPWSCHNPQAQAPPAAAYGNPPATGDRHFDKPSAICQPDLCCRMAPAGTQTRLRRHGSRPLPRSMNSRPSTTLTCTTST